MQIFPISIASNLQNGDLLKCAYNIIIFSYIKTNQLKRIFWNHVTVMNFYKKAECILFIKHKVVEVILKYTRNILGKE